MCQLRSLFAVVTLSAAMSSQTAFTDLTNRYVIKANPGAAEPYDSAGNAAGDIQTAINYARVGETVLVAAATYDIGGMTVPGRYLTNRVYVSKIITVRSVDNDPANTIIKGAWDPVATNGWLAIRCVYMVAGSSLIGFTLTNGATISSNDVHKDIISQDACGGGVCAWGTAAATISNCIITGNSAWGDRSQSAKYGAGVCDGTYFNCAIIGNSSMGHGGGAESAILSNCTLAGNAAAGWNGGGAHRGTLYSCLVSNNRAANGAGLAGWNAAVPCKAYNCLIVGNQSTSHGAGAGQSAMLYNCTVARNTAGGSGGGAHVSTLIGCQVISNRCGNMGGGASACLLTNCIVAYNASSGGGGGLYGPNAYNCLVYGNFGYGGGAYLVNGNILDSCTIVGNNSGILSESGNTTNRIVNCIIYSNQNNWVKGAATLVFQFTNSCTTPDWPGWDAGNITNNPRFVAFGSDYGTNHVAGNYRLRWGSPCINTGMNETWMTGAVDLDGMPRILPKVGGTVDMGAYEFIVQSGSMFSVR